MIKAIIFDVDGTLTDGKIYMGNDGEIFKAFSVKDGYAIHNLMPQNNIVPVILTARTSKIVENRCKEIGIELLYQGVSDKLLKLKEIAGELNIKCSENGKYEEIAYMGDDVLDIPCMEVCGYVAAPMNAVQKVKNIADYVATVCGGDGAAREFVEYLCEKNFLINRKMM